MLTSPLSTLNNSTILQDMHMALSPFDYASQSRYPVLRKFLIARKEGIEPKIAIHSNGIPENLHLELVINANPQVLHYEYY